MSGVELGCEISMSKLVIRYSEGNGVVQDLAEAIKWLFLAAAKGDSEARDTINALSQSNSREYVEGQQRANAWQNQHPKAFMNPN